MSNAKESRQVVPMSKDALLKSYRSRLKTDINSMVDNFTETIKLCKVVEENQINTATQCEEDAFEMQVRAANMVRVWVAFFLHLDFLRKATNFKQFFVINQSHKR